MHYAIKLRREADASGWKYRYPLLVYVRGEVDLSNPELTDEDRRDELQRMLREHDLSLKDQYTLRPVEHVRIVPNERVRPDHPERRFGDPHFTGDLDIPDDVLDRVNDPGGGADR